MFIIILNTITIYYILNNIAAMLRIKWRIGKKLNVFPNDKSVLYPKSTNDFLLNFIIFTCIKNEFECDLKVNE